MNKTTEEKSAIALALLLTLPPKVRDSLAESASFRRRFELNADATLTFGKSGISFKQSTFYSAVRNLYSVVMPEVEAVTVGGGKATLSFQEYGNEKGILIAAEGKTASVPSFWFLSSDKTFRLREFDREVSQRNLSGEVVSVWRKKLAENPLSDEDANELYEEFRINPQEVAAAIASEIRKRNSDISVLVPRSMAYYDRLIGNLANSSGIDGYIDGQAREQINRLLDWDFERGLGQCLLFCAQPRMAPLVDISRKDAGEVEAFFGWLETNGDSFSQVAGFEVGIRAVDRFPALEPILLRIARSIRDADVIDKRGRLALTSSLFIFVDGELSRIGLFRDKPPFWRRLAAIAQASLIERQFIGAGVSLNDPSEWAIRARGEYFHMQSLADLRLEPRWLPDLMTAEQLRFEFVSRLYMAADQARTLIPDGELRRLLIEAGPESLFENMELPFAYLPGPLEGGSVARQPFPDDMLAELRTPKDRKVLEARIFAGVVNLALVFRLEPEIAQRIANILRTVKYRLSLGKDEGMTFPLLAGLALVAAITRSPELAEEVRILARVLRRRGELSNRADNQMRIAMIACASRYDLDEWCKAVGDWFLELAYEEMNIEMASGLRSHLRQLSRIVPQLWQYSAKADAALSAVLGDGN